MIPHRKMNKCVCVCVFLPTEMVHTAMILMRALVWELKRLWWMGFLMPMYRSREMAHRCMMDAVENRTSR